MFRRPVPSSATVFFRGSRSIALCLALIAGRTASASEWVDPPVGVGDGGNSEDVVLADLDGDGDLDAAVSRFVSTGTDGSRVYFNQGGAQGGTPGTFVDSGQALATGRAAEVDAGDLDGDGDTDLVFNATPGGVQVWINQGGAQGGTAGTFSRGNPSLDLPASSGLRLGDLDGDGDLDVWVTVVNQADRVLLNDGNAGFTASPVPETDASYAVGLGDLDGDGDLDAVTATSSGGAVWINQSGAQGGTAASFVRRPDPLGSQLLYDVLVADFDGDGDPDVYLGADGGDGLWRNAGGAQGGTPGDLSLELEGIASGESRALAAGDLDLDGDIDVVLGQRTGFTTLIQRNDVLFFEARPPEGTGWTGGLALGDLDGDGLPDLFRSRFGLPEEVWLNAHVPAPFRLGDVPASVPYVPPSIQPFANATVTVPGPVTWTGGSITLEATGSPVADEQLGGIGTNRLVLILTTETSAQVQELLRGLNYTRDLGNAVNPPPRRLRLTLMDGDGNTGTVETDVRYSGNEIVGISLSPEYILLATSDHCSDFVSLVRHLADGSTDSSPETVAPEALTLLIVDPLELDVHWRTNGLGGGIEVCPDGIAPGTTTTLLVKYGGFVARAAVSRIDHTADHCVYLFAWLLTHPGLPLPLTEFTSRAAQATAPPEPGLSLAPFKALESLLARSPEGRRLAGLYWRHSGDVVRLLVRNPDLIADVVGVLKDFQPGVAALLAGNGAGTTISAEMVERLDALWSRLAELGSPELAADLNAERDRLGGFGGFVGTDFDSWADRLALPAVNGPFVTGSNPRRVDGRFVVDANRVEGLAYSLWTAADPDPETWTEVADVTIETPDPLTLRLTDPAPPEGPAFYRIRAVPAAR